MAYADFNNKIVSLSRAARSVSSGDVIWVGSTLSISYAFLDQLAQRYEELQNVTLIGNMFLKTHEIFTDEKYSKAFRVVFITGKQVGQKPMTNVTYAFSDGSASFRAIADKYKINTLAVEVCPPENRDECNLGAFASSLTGIVNGLEDIKNRIVIINNSQSKSGGTEKKDFIRLCECDSVCMHTHALFPATGD